MQGHPRSPVEAALHRRGEIGRIAEVFRLQGAERTRDVKIESLPSAGGCTRHAAEDGGSSLVEFESFTLFIVKGWSALYEPVEEGGACRYAQWSSDSWADVGVVVPHHYAEERVRLYREIVELWLARRSLSFGGASLWDGSIAPLVAGHRPGSSDMSMSEALSKALYNAGGSVLRRIVAEHEGAPLAARRVILDIYGVDKLVEAVGVEDAPWIAFLEWFEKLIALKRYLEEAWARKVMPIFISKTSRSSILVRGSLPDVYYLRIKEPVEAFLTKPIVVGFEGLRFTFGRPGGGDAGRGEVRGPFFPEEEGLEEFFRERLSVVVFYARLTRGGPILRVDVAVPSDRLEGASGDEEVIRNVAVARLLSIPHPNGYPLPLQVAHANARVSEREKRAVLEVLGLSFERLGRGVLTL